MMANFSKREIFIDLTSEKKSTQRIFAYLSIFLVIFAIGFFLIETTERLLLVLPFIMSSIGLFALWASFQNKVRRYQNQPYLILDEAGVSIFGKNWVETVHWQNVNNIDIYQGGDHASMYYFIEADKMIFLNRDITTTAMIDTLKRYAERYGTTRFIY